MSHTWDFYLCYFSLKQMGKRMILKYIHCWSPFWHAQFPSFIYHVMRCYQTRPGYLFLFKMVLFFEHHFKWSETFELASYESSIATSTATLLLQYNKYKTMTSLLHSLNHSRKTALPALFLECLTLALSSLLLACLRKVKTILFYKLNYNKNVKKTHSHIRE